MNSVPAPILMSFVRISLIVWADSGVGPSTGFMGGVVVLHRESDVLVQIGNNLF